MSHPPAGTSIRNPSSSTVDESDEVASFRNDDVASTGHPSMAVGAQSMIHYTHSIFSGANGFGNRSVATSSSSLSNTSSDAIGSNGSVSKQILDKTMNFLVSLNSKKARQDSMKSVLLHFVIYGYMLFCTVVLSSVPSTLYEEGTLSASNADSKGSAPLWGVIAGWIQRVLFYPINAGAEHYSYVVVIALSATFVFLEALTLFMYYVYYMLHSRGHRFSEKVKKLVLPFTIFMLPLSYWMIWLHCIPMSSSFMSSRNEYFPSIVTNSTLNIVFMAIGSIGVLLNIVIGIIGTIVTCETIPPTATRFASFTIDRPDIVIAITLLNQLSVVFTVILNTNNVIASSVVKFILSGLVSIYFLRKCPYFKIWENGVVFGCLLAKTLGSIGPLVAGAIKPIVITQLETIGGLMFGITVTLQVLGFLVGTVSLSIYVRLLVSSVKKYISNTMTEFPDKSGAHQIYSSFEGRKSMNQLVLYLRLSIESAFSESPSALDVSLQFLKHCSNKSCSNVDFLLVGAVIATFYSSHEDVFTSNTHAMNMLINAKKNNPSQTQKYMILLRSKELEINTEKISNISVELRQALQRIQRKQQAISYFHKEFFKELLSEKPSLTKLLNINRSATKLLSDCDSGYRTLYSKNSNDKILLRSYAMFLESFKWEFEAANELLEEANAADDDDPKKIATNVTKKHSLPYKFNKSTRVHPTSSLNAYPQPKKISQVDKTTEEEMGRIEDEDNWESVSNGGDLDKKENVLRLSINTTEENTMIKIWFAAFCLLSIVVVPILFATSSIKLNQVSARVALEEKVCSLSGIPHLIIAQIRSVQSKYRYSNTPEKKAEIPFVVSKATSQLKLLLEKVNSVKLASTSGEFIPEVVTTFTDVKWPYYIPIKQNNEFADPIFEAGNSSISQFVDLMLIQGSQILTLIDDLEAFNLTRSNFPFLVFYLNRREMTTACDNFCTSFIQSSKSEIYQGSIAFYSVCGVVLGVYLAFSIIFIVVARNHLLQIERILKYIFISIPKEESGRVFHSLEFKTTHHSYKETSSIFTPYLIYMLVSLSIIVIIVISSILIIIEFDRNVSTSTSTMQTVSLLNTVVRTSMRVNFRLNELVVKSKLMLIPWNIVKEDNMHELRNCDQAWREISVGGANTGYESPISGLSSEIDVLFTGTCNSTNSTLTNKTLSFHEIDLYYECQGMNQLVSEFISQAIELNNDYYSNYYDQQTAITIYFKNIYFVSISFANKSFEFISKYVTYAKNASLSLSISAFAISISLCLLLLLWSYSTLSKYWDEKHNARTLLNYISGEAIDQNEDLKQYVMAHNIPNKYPKPVQKFTNMMGLTNHSVSSDLSEDPMSMTKSIMNAAADGCIVCNPEGSIVIFNKAAENMFGYHQSELLGAPLTSLFSIADQQKIEKSIFSITSSKNAYTETFELSPVRKNKTCFSASVSISISFFNKKSIIACFVKDITSEKKQTALISEEKKKSEELLLNILPLPVAIRLKQGETSICEKFNDLTILFSDMVGFTSMSSTMTPNDLIVMLGDIVLNFDKLTEKYYIDKIKTIGDAYFCVAGAHASKSSDHAERMLKFSIDVFAFLNTFNKQNGWEKKINVRIGLHTGDCVGGVIGFKKFAYDLWGDSINVASRMESTGVPGRIHISRSTYERVHDLGFEFEEREGIQVKGKGLMKTYLLASKHHLPAIEDAPIQE
ncbi:hypothetical protein C9374_011806 [Naegleria lovaniensis]|uniref:Adenylate and Guanylate cyclase catalytic domain containing protein n=1 Tax=Naegleria lovaniensis TaxID=51637 RepID=A0AA88KIB0_NAELO|nr:uncharacterized protein C9374_011806 [Naegleria lovaniensis]KAG2373717.1 hypothetical protein C9374_011806 [Naegleria lovaniensis]